MTMEEQNNKLPSEFEAIINELEESRSAYVAKTKGLFKRAFLRTWAAVLIVFLIIIFVLTDPGDDLLVAIIGPTIFSAFAGLLFGGIYTLIRKGINSHKFSVELKDKLVSKLVTHLNPNLSFSKTGITKTEFNEVAFFRGNQFKSEDSITGIIDGVKIKMAECTQYSTSSSNNNKSTTTYFKGMFVKLEFPEQVLSGTLKVVPKLNLDMLGGFLQNVVNQLATSSRFIIEENKLEMNVLEGKDYSIFCDNDNIANSLVNERFIKVIDFMINKYEGKNAFLYLNGNSVYCALESKEDLFEADAFLKHSLIESNLAGKFYNDLLNIDQLIKELLLLKKAVNN